MFVSCVSGCGQGAPTDAFELSGRVSVLLESGEEGGPIEDARIQFVSDTLIVEETQTDGDGRYRMRVMTDIDFGQVRATAEGFRTREESVFFDSPTRRVDLPLRRAPE
ncbi:MAG: carboxypeptidase-like regulatory domain-containing protein [Sandaracinaceae bacterium]